MMPVLYRFTFSHPYVFAYLLALALVAYTVWNGWRTAVGPFDPKAGDYREASREDRINRARTYLLYGVGLAVLGLWYALPELPFGIKELPFLGKAKGEGIPLHTYGILIGVGFLGAVSVSAYLAEREWTGEKGKKMKEQIYDLAFYVFVGGIGGSVLLFNIVNIKEGRLQMGMVFQGGLICAAAVAYWYGKKHDIDFLRLSDIGLPTVSLGSAFGRLGCFSAGCCWGKPKPAGASMAVQFPGPQVQDLVGTQSGGVASAAYGSMADGRSETRWFIESTGPGVEQAQAGAVRLSDWVSQHGHTIPIHPTQLYESAAQFLLFALFISLRPFRRFHGQLAGLWLMVYAVERTTVELFRGDGERGTIHGWFAFIPRDAWYNISTSQLGSFFIFATGVFILVREWRKYAARPKVEGLQGAKVASA